jgi:hypothetical protein
VHFAHRLAFICRGFSGVVEKVLSISPMIQGHPKMDGGLFILNCTMCAAKDSFATEDAFLLVF